MMLLKIVTLALIVSLVGAEPIPGAENVCNKTVKQIRDKIVDVPVTYELEYEGRCGLLSCTKKRVETRMDSKVKTIVEEVQVSACCDGYAETPDRKCAPICLYPCQNGRCILPGVCRCDPMPTESTPGFVGSSCNRFVCNQPNRWGANCEKECDCPINSYCSASTGDCKCRAGWRGQNCTEECSPDEDCNGYELPPIMDPESNIISRVGYGQSQKLEALAPKALMRDSDEELGEAFGGGYYATNVGINLFLILVVVALIYAVVCYKRSLDRIRAELYYQPTSRSASSDTYSAPSTYSYGPNLPPGNLQNRPRMPIPEETDNLGKNLNFASATRFLLQDGGNQPSKDNQLVGNKNCSLIPGSKIEAHLISSQKSSEQNIYYDIQNQSYNEKSFHIADASSVQEQTSMNASTIDLSHYQVPRCPRSKEVDPSADDEQCQIDNESAQESDDYESEEQNHYEEIKPKSIKK